MPARPKRVLQGLASITMERLFILIWMLVRAIQRLLIRPSLESRMRKQLEEENAKECKPPIIFFAGCGVYYFWQAGAAAYLAENYDMSKFQFAGASSGALTAVLTACGVDLDFARKSAFAVAERNGLYDRPWGAVGVWGVLVRQWLQDLLPHDAAQCCHQRVHVLVTSTTWRNGLLEHRWVNSFHSNQELLDVLLASIHIPWVMDTRPYVTLRGKRHVDVAWFVSREDMCLDPSLVVDPTEDRHLERHGWADFLSMETGARACGLMERGRQWAREVERERGVVLQGQ